MRRYSILKNKQILSHFLVAAIAIVRWAAIAQPSPVAGNFASLVQIAGGPRLYDYCRHARLYGEQIDRMNRSINTRSDLYSLGVTLYQMHTGALPYAAADPMEWVHCQIACQPTEPYRQSESAVVVIRGDVSGKAR